jgi:hypothetical protein
MGKNKFHLKLVEFEEEKNKHKIVKEKVFLDEKKV